MKHFGLLTLYLALSLILAAVLLYPMTLAIPTDLNIPPEKLLYRTAMLIAAIGFWPFLKCLNTANRQTLGFGLERSQALYQVALGVLWGVLIMGIITASLLLLDVRQPVIELQEKWAGLPRLIIGSLIAGLLIGLIEEIVFRGVLFSAIRKRHSYLVAALLPSALYGVLHFVNIPPPPPDQAITLTSGLQMLAAAFHQFSQPLIIGDSLIALFFAGLFLSLVREIKGNIALCIGIHAGWVLIIKATKYTTDIDADSPAAWLIGSYDKMTGWLASAVLLTLILVIEIVRRRTPQN